MDDDALRAAFKAHTTGQEMFTRRMAIHLAMMADMRPMSMVWRCEKLHLIRPGSWEWFKANGGITDDHVAEAKADMISAAREPI